MENRLVLDSEIGICGVERTKGLFINYHSEKHGNIQFEFFKNKNDNINYYLIDNQDISRFNAGKDHDNMLIIYSKIQKLITELLDKDITVLQLRALRNKLFNFNKYRNDSLNCKDLYDIVINNKKELNSYIDKLYPTF